MVAYNQYLYTSERNPVNFGTTQKKGVMEQQQRPSQSQDTPELATLVAELSKTTHSFMQETRASIQNLEVQVGQLSKRIPERPPNTLPNNTEINPREDCKALTMAKGAESKEVHAAEELKEEKARSTMEPEVPHPQKLQEETKDEQFTQFLENFKMLHINIPFVEVLEKMPPYMACMKDLLSEKKALKGDETVLEIQEAQTTRINLQMADKYLRQAYGLVENVVVKVEDLFLLVDFVILDMGEDTDDSIILGRPFLATGRALIDVEKGELVLRL
ncbi:uncharacterized protein LOC110271961 [Arachis ipaensis]|uniref:uncharacterized protein LOC110271961 n=1 Tax=Arachis ipaensis TaxID=130454 RepID=UPI000A2B3471|nr:uncharacterized protein LOC110271961 [Arachis ipaensis]